MENIVTATQAGLPLVDGSTTAGNGADNGAGGRFGMFVDAELALLAGNARTGKKGKAEEGMNPLAALLMASLFQGNGAAAVAGGDTQALQEDPTAGGAAGLGGAGMALVQLLAANDVAGRAFTELLASGGEAGSGLRALLGASLPGAADLAGAVGAAAEKGENAFPALLAALTGGETGGEAAPAPASGGMQALDEIKRLFVDLIAAEQVAPVKADPTGPRDAASALPAATQAGASPEEGAPALARAVVALIGDLQADGARDSLPGGAAASQSIQAAGDGDAVVSDAAPGRKAEKDTGDFSSALRAYRADAPAAATAGQPSEKSAAIALRRGSEAFDSIVDTIKTMSGTQQKDMEISLKPDFLGRVVIRLSMDGDGLVAKIAASNPKVQDAFMNQVPSLQNSLAEQGLKDVRIVVTPGFVDDAALQQQAQGRGQWRQEKQKRDRGAVGSVEGPASGSAALVYETAYRTGTIDRLA